MARRTTTLVQIPWTGGVNTSVDAGMIPKTDLVQAENVVFSNSGTRVKREDFQYLGTALPAISTRASSGTTRTIKFTSSINIASPKDEILVVGEQITITGASGTETDSYAGTFYITGISTTTNTNDTITYTHSSFSEGSTAVSSSFAIARTSDYLDVRDYWRTDASYVKSQRIMAFSSQGKLFSYTAAGLRTEIITPPEVFTVTFNAADVAGSYNNDYFTTTDQNGTVGVYFTNAGGAWPGGAVDRSISISFTNGDSANTLATAMKTAIDADANFVATVSTNVVTITHAYMGTRTNPTNANMTDVTIAVTTEGTLSAKEPLGTPPLTAAHSVVVNERYIFSMSGTGYKPRYFHPETNTAYHYALGGTPPDGLFLVEHQGRLWMNDKTDKDLIHYSAPGDPETWLGVGDSGALLIAPGDGDSRGISATFPPLKDRLFVAKGNKLYQVAGYAPEEYQVQPLTVGVGCESQKSAVAVDAEDVAWISGRGIHSLAATDAYGDFEASFLSSKIQPTFKDWPAGSLDLSSATYVPSLSSVVFAVVEEGGTSPNALWLYNTNVKEWYTWPSVDPICVTTYLDTAETKRLIWGTSDSRIVTTQNGDFTDYGTTAISYRIKTGNIYPDDNPHSYKGFKKLGLIFKPKSRYSFTVNYKIDNLPRESISFAYSTQGDVLGTTLILGQSVLADNHVLGPVLQPIAGYGRGIQIEIINNNQDEQVEIYGYVIEYEAADIMQDINTGS